MSHKEDIRTTIRSKVDLKGLSPAYQDEIINQLEKNVTDQVFVSVMDTLGDKDRHELEVKSALGNTEEANKFLAEKIPDFNTFVDGIITSVVDEFRELRDTGPELFEDVAITI